MTFITQTLRQCSNRELELLKTVPPTEASLALANRIGQMMGEYAYPGDMVRESIAYEADKLGWPNQIATKIGDLAYQGLQRS